MKGLSETDNERFAPKLSKTLLNGNHIDYEFFCTFG